ncbi:fibrinogen-like protein 1 isoform X1 [Branchiostoma floridae x Branchiostoma belcheri]
MGRVERVMPLLCITWLGLITGVVGTTPPQDCADLFAAGTRQSGTYTVGEPSPYRVYCDMSFLGGGWTVLQRRQDGSVDFAKTWEEYQQGFGNLTGEFWLGLDNIHTLTTAKSNNILQIELEDFNGTRRYARYSTFSVGDASGNYVVSISGYSGDAGNSLTNSGLPDINGRMFSTIDRDNDGNSGANCASFWSYGGWWYPLSCGQSFLNGRYDCHQSSVNCGAGQGVVWSTWGGTSYFLKKTTIMIRPADFTAEAANCSGPGVVIVAGAAVGCFTGGLLLGGAAVFLFLRIRRAKNGGKRDEGDEEYENVQHPRVASQRPGSGSYVEVSMETIEPPTVRSPQPLNDD